MRGRLIVIAGPTAVGKTDYSISLALKYGSPVISCDSRQIYREMSIGTAVPDASQLSAVKHYFIHSHSVMQNYTAGDYEIEAVPLIEKLFAEGRDTLIMSGGSGFYIDAVCNGLDCLPDADPVMRKELTSRLKEEGVTALADELKRIDPASWAAIDRNNGQRVVRAIEVFRQTGKPFVSFRLQAPKERSFDIEKYCLTRPREELYSRIDSRVLKMIDEGLVDEVRSLTTYRGRPALRTVGYSEIFRYLDGEIPLEEAIQLIQRNTRHYAKKQLTWWKRDPSVKWIIL
ncbi:MAG: tRNA (adenosine(37)-N6)-dimethylallyltransferase MiaA [Candidatus Cryptobacteroides sp.]|nr:tRNA (adenosine(37)-N6)-dimethylallyltransferase MiaA [Bacteroidales bacterium]